MSRRSYQSFSQSHEKRLSKYRVTDQDVYTYVLRVSYLSYLLQPRPTNPDGSHTPTGESREHHSRLSSTLSSSLLSLGDLFKDARDGSRSVKFPDKLIKVLEQKLQMIAMGQDPGYTDQLVRRTMAKFYGHFMDKTFKQQMKENRKIEELILMFATDATGVLKKEPSLAGDGWKFELNRQIAQFVRVLRECLRNVSGVSPELLQRLETYTAKLAPSQASSDSGYESSSSPRDRDSWTVLSHNVNDMTLVKAVAALFKIPESDILSEVDQIRGLCTEKAALTDLKTCLKNINAGVTFPGNREDFETEAAWQWWKHQETTQLQQLMLVMIQLNPELAKSAPSQIVPASQQTRPGSMYSAIHERPPSLAVRTPSVSGRRSMYGNLDIDVNAVTEELDADDEVPVGINFTYIPPNPRKYYKRLLEIALVADLEVMLSPEVDDNDEVSLGILSPTNIELINECALRWRIGHPYRAACFLDIVKQFYERQEVPLECIPEALQTIQKVKADTSLDKWMVNDLEYVNSLYTALYKIFLSEIYNAMEKIPGLKSSDIGPYLAVIEDLQLSELLDHGDVDISTQIADISERVKEAALQSYHVKLQELQSAPGVNRALPLLLMSDEVEKWAKLLDKRFPQPILGQLDLVSLVVEVQIPTFVSDLEASRKRLFESSMNGPTPDIPIQDLFALYRRTKTLLSMFEAFVPEGDIKFDMGSYFEPYVRQWLINTDDKTTQWVQAAIAADKFEAEGPEGHSSSIVDLFDSLRSPISVLEDLEWADPYQEARFYTSLAKTISRAVEQYCRKIEEMFMTEMYPRPTDYLQPQKSSAWLEKARQLANQTEKKVEPFNFQPESCVKLNNVEAARKLLDNMYNQMNADKLAEVLDSYAPPVPDKVERQKFLFTVKIVHADGLVPTDNSPSSKLDSFVTLSDEAGTRVAKTRTIYETNSPRWEESFDISVEKALWLMVSVRDRALVGKHDTVGRAYLCLDPKRFGDLLTHDLWMDLDTQGRVLIRVSMEGEKDDVQFFFGRAFRSLKRSESDMVRIFIDKMLPFIRQNISRPVLKTLIKASSMGIDVNKAIGNVTALYRSALSSSSNEVQIPLPSDEKPRKRPEELTDVEIEQAIVPLFDYFDANLQILNTYLSELMKEKVMKKTWKEILLTIEGLLVPPLSTVETDMKPLSDKEADIVLKWLKFLRDYFFAGGEGLPLETLHNPKHEDIVMIRYYYDWHTDALMEECVRKMQETFRASPSMRRAKSVYQHKNLGTIKERNKEKKEEKVKESNGGEVIMRILRMRPGTADFIGQQLQIMDAMKKEQEMRAAELAQRKLSRPSQRRKEAAPPVPPVPPLPQDLR